MTPKPTLHPLADALRAVYRAGEDDETMEPLVLVDATGRPVGRVRDGDYVVFQGTVLNPIAGHYGTIHFSYFTLLPPYGHYYAFVMPEPASGILLALGLWSLKRR